MSSYQQLQQQFVQEIEGGIGVAIRTVGDDPLSGPLVGLINALPFYGDSSFIQCHRGTLINLLQVNLPNSRIAPEPSSSGVTVTILMEYTGPYSGYRDAFYNGITPNAGGQEVATQVQAMQPALNSTWWSNYGVSILSDAIRLSTSIPLDTGKLSGALSGAHSALMPALTASYLGVFTQGYAPTSAALRPIMNNGQGPQSAQLLAQAIARGQFTANINQAISAGGDSTNAAVWFLFNLWVTLKALGAADVDAVIQQSQTQGLIVPAPVGPGSWWNGGYTQWYTALSGSDVQAKIAPRISDAMPEKETIIQRVPPDGFPISNTFNKTVNNGYPLSLCQWGNLNWFPPPSSSCFGKGTQVLMADGSGKAIETLNVGDEVMSSQGARKIVLIESPLRRERSLYQLNKLPVFATAAHPFRTQEADNCLRTSIDPWSTIDSVPSMIAGGVSALSRGSVLAGLSNGQHVPVSVTSIDQYPATEPEERVYDLLLENWTQGYVTWFVGGPSVYCAVDAETADPAYDRLCTLAIVSAMNGAIDACRTNFSGQDQQMAQAIASLNIDAVIPFNACYQESDDKLALPRVPDTDFFLQNGLWDSCASQLEAQLIRHHARGIRRWLNPAVSNGTTVASDQWYFALRDIELTGDYPIPPGTAPSFTLTSYSAQVGGKSICTTLDTADVSRYFLAPDTLIAIDSPQTKDGLIAIRGQLCVDGHCHSEFYCDVSGLDLGGKITEHFLYHPKGPIVGRLALAIQSDSTVPAVANSINTRVIAGQTPKMYHAVNLGQQLGEQLSGLKPPSKHSLSTSSP
ncbi:Hint domain-containing homing endonuclease [Pantoea sp. At-9b]|uniref:Hint domain-containing homing endonuclease n=1 Tax=Pantoea sp. (strain At-9b) TaxID=592316 RepID=UPI0001B3E26B|nr:Hint domain-containing homing endonuclease [Pantoea sp. At-9b]ADU72924.1 Hom_end-associated Hint domain protein [Pantoea sp. At-9b]